MIQEICRFFGDFVGRAASNRKRCLNAFFAQLLAA
jgi:hypothetical protein